MPKFRCYLPQKEGDDKEAKKTKDGWDATFVFDGPTAPKGMVCKVIPPPAKAVPAPKPVTATAVQAPTDATAVAPVTAATETAAVTATDASAPVVDETVEPISVVEPSAAPTATPVSDSVGGLVAVAAVAAVATLAVSSVLGNGNGKGKGNKGKGQGKATDHQPDSRKQKEEKERRECGAQTEAVKADADSGLQRYDGVSAALNRLLEHLRSYPDDREALEALQRSVGDLSKRVVVLEGRVKQKGSSKRDSGLRTDRSRPQKPAPRR